MSFRDISIQIYEGLYKNLYMKVKVKSLSGVRLCNPWTVAYNAPPSMGFSTQEYWSGLPFPSSYYTREN